MDTQLTSENIFKRHIALPQDHGSWVFLLSPLLIGLFAGRSWTPAAAYLILACMSAFLARQPLTIMVKVYSKRRPKRELAPAWFWTGIYAVLGLVGVSGLAYFGHTYLLILAVPGFLVFFLHLYLVSKRAERRQMGVELVASGVLALAAPAAYWVGVGGPQPEGWWLFGLVWFQSAASIVYAYLRLEQRVLPAVPDLAARMKMGRRALLYTTFNLTAVAVLSALSWLPLLLIVPFALQWAETLYGTLVRPAVGYKPTAIGLRQLAVSSLFTVLFIIAWV